MTDVMEPALVEETDAPAIVPDSADIEALAQEIGWKPADQWKGEGHMPASDFLRHQAARAKEKSDEAKTLGKRLDKLARTAASINERQLREQREELEGRYQDMVAANKPAEARRIAKDIDALESQADEPDEAVEDFKTRNAAWFEKDEDAMALAYGICQREAAKGTSTEDQLKKAEAKVREKFPHLFSDAKPEAAIRRAPVVSSPQSRAAPGRSREFTAETLPPDAKKALQNYLGRLKDPARGPAFTKSYLEEYNKENAQ